MAVIFNWKKKKKHKCGYFMAKFCIIPIKWKIPNVKYFKLKYWRPPES